MGDGNDQTIKRRRSVLTHVGEEEEDPRCQGDNLSRHTQVVRGCCVRVRRLEGRKMRFIDNILLIKIQLNKQCWEKRGDVLKSEELQLWETQSTYTNSLL